MRLFPLLAGALVGVWSFEAGAATLIAPDTASGVSASTVFGGNAFAPATIDGSGLSGSGASATHVTYNPFAGTHWTGNETQGAISWGFNTAVDLVAAYFWNHDTYPTLSGQLNFYTGAMELIGMQAVSLTAPAQAVPVESQFVAFAATMQAVRGIQFVLDAAPNQQFSQYRGLAEVRFVLASTAAPPPPPDVPPIPLPAAGWLLLGALGGLAALRRRKG